MHYSQLNFTFSLGFSTDLSPLPYPAHYPKQPTVVNHYQSTHVSPPAFSVRLPPAYAPSHQLAYQLTRQQGLCPSLVTPTKRGAGDMHKHFLVACSP